jgi:hypothetical protein
MQSRKNGLKCKCGHRKKCSGERENNAPSSYYDRARPAWSFSSILRNSRSKCTRAAAALCSFLRKRINSFEKLTASSNSKTSKTRERKRGIHKPEIFDVTVEGAADETLSKLHLSAVRLKGFGVQTIDRLKRDIRVFGNSGGVK